MNDSRLYLVYGLRLLSDHPLPLTPAMEGSPDVILTDGGFLPPDMTPHPRRNPDTQWSRSEAGARLRYCNARGELLEYRFSAGGGRVKMLRTRTDVDVTPITLGSAMGAALFLRGIPVLHATAVAIGDRAVVIAGNSGAGKSTLSAALIKQGASLLADDLAALYHGDDGYLVQPGFPRIKLYRESGAVAGLSGDGWPRIFDDDLCDDKRWLDLGGTPGGFCSVPRRVTAVYLLEARSVDLKSPRMEQLHPREASVVLTRHFYGTITFDIELKTRLRWAGRIAGQIPVSRVTLPGRLDRLADVAGILMESFRL